VVGPHGRLKALRFRGQRELRKRHAPDLVIDQTLYWKVIASADEAWFFAGMLNSHAMTDAITPFNPKGAFGERHIHALPYRLMPAFDASNEDHLRIGLLAREASGIVGTMVAADAYLNDPTRPLHIRRGRVREALVETEVAQELEQLCAAALGTTVLGEETEELEVDQDNA